jgi:hypothetical protein
VTLWRAGAGAGTGAGAWRRVGAFDAPGLAHVESVAFFVPRPPAVLLAVCTASACMVLAPRDGAGSSSSGGAAAAAGDGGGGGGGGGVPAMQVLWSAELAGACGVAWTPIGNLLVAAAGGIALLSPDLSGAAAAGRCVPTPVGGQLRSSPPRDHVHGGSSPPPLADAHHRAPARRVSRGDGTVPGFRAAQPAGAPPWTHLRDWVSS